MQQSQLFSHRSMPHLVRDGEWQDFRPDDANHFLRLDTSKVRFFMLDENTTNILGNFCRRTKSLQRTLATLGSGSPSTNAMANFGQPTCADFWIREAFPELQSCVWRSTGDERGMSTMKLTSFIHELDDGLVVLFSLASEITDAGIRTVKPSHEVLCLDQVETT